MIQESLYKISNCSGKFLLVKSPTDELAVFFADSNCFGYKDIAKFHPQNQKFISLSFTHARWW